MHLSIYANISTRMLDESLRWLIANAKIEKAKEIIKKACRWNRKDYNQVMHEIAMSTGQLGDLDTLNNINNQEGEEQVTHKGNEEDLGVEQYTLIDIFRHKMIRNVSFIIWYTWLVSHYITKTLSIFIVWRF